MFSKKCFQENVFKKMFSKKCFQKNVFKKIFSKKCLKKPIIARLTSGLRVLYHYNVQQPKESEVVQVKVRCTECPFPVYKDLDESKVYRVAVNNFLIGGGDSYTIKPYILNKTVAGKFECQSGGHCLIVPYG